MADPKNIPLSKLDHTKKELDYSYKLLMVLANEINGDVVSYGKVYNKIEDGSYDYNIVDYQKFSVKNYKKWLTTIDSNKRF